MTAAGARGWSLELFFINGRPDGMLTARVFNWTGHVLVTPRTQISEALGREEASHTGIYLLIGERDGEPQACIGEGENISERIRSHVSRMDWWNTAVLITTAADTLNKAHVRYLESRLIGEARAIGRIGPGNGNMPALPGLSGADRASMEAFPDHLLMVLPAVRVDFLLAGARPGDVPAVPADDVPVFELRTKKHGIHAVARLENGEFVVRKGSLARREWSGDENSCYRQLFAGLVRTGLLCEEGGHRVFSENYAFSSPSAAAAVINGRSANGPREWKVQGQGRSYGQWEAGRLARDVTEAAG